MNSRCEYCNSDLSYYYIDIGPAESPIFMMTLTCDCEEWLAVEIEYTDMMSQKYGEVE